MKHRSALFAASLLFAIGVVAAAVSLAPGPHAAMAGAQPTATPCPANKVPDTYHGSGCGTPTPTPTSNRPPPVPEIHYSINGRQGPITVTQGDHVTLQWIVYNRGQGWFSASVDDAMFSSLDGSCVLQPGQQCSRSADVIFPAAGPIIDTVRVAATVPPASTKFADATLLINVVAPTPRPTALGDFNCDGTVNAIDAALILQIIAGLAVPLPCTGAGDVNHDGLTDAIDASLVLQYVAGLIPPFT